MNQKTLQNIFKSHETKEFYKRYLEDLGCREDRRKLLQQRPIRISARNNSIVLNCGQTIIMANLQTSIQPVIYSPITQLYGQSLIKIKVASGHQHKRQLRSDKAIEQFITSRVQWKNIENQLIQTDDFNGQLYAHKGEINLRIVGDDGCADQYSLLSVYFLLTTSSFQSFKVKKQKITFQNTFKLKAQQFLFPIKYCIIFNKIIRDPSLSEEESSDAVFTIIKDLKQTSKPQTVIQKLKKSQYIINEEIIKKVLSQWQVDLFSVYKKFQTMLSSLQKNGEYVESLQI